MIHVGDRVRITAPKARMDEVSSFFGDSEHEASALNPIGFMVGIVIGLLIGLIAIPLPGGGKLSLGIAGGALVAGLVLGRLHRTGPILWSIPFPTANALGQYGMLAFLAYAGSTSGSKLVTALETGLGPPLFLVGLIVTTTAALMLRFLGPRVGGSAVRCWQVRWLAPRPSPLCWRSPTNGPRPIRGSASGTPWSTPSR